MAAPRTEARQGELNQRERRDDVHLVDPLELVERIVGERRLRARAEQARVVDQQVDLLAGGLDERPTVLWVGEVAGDRDHALQPLRGRRGGSAPPRASTISRQPRSSRARASARPRPREAPVTIATGMPQRIMHLQVHLKSNLVKRVCFKSGRA